MGVGPHLPNLAVQDQVIHSPSWGAAAFGPAYLLAMRAYRHAGGLILAIVLFVAAQLYPDPLASLGQLPLVVLVAAWGATVVGGRRVAWRTRRWQDFADFLACQRAWDRWGKGGLAVAAVLIALDYLLRTAAPPRGLRAREILESAIMAAVGGVGAIGAWWYVRRHRERLRPWQRLGLRALVVVFALVCVLGVFSLLIALYLPDAADLTLGGSMFVGGVVAAIAAWQYGRRTARRLWWLRLLLRLLVLAGAFVAAAGALLVLRTLRLPEVASGVTVGITLLLGLILAAWPAAWRDQRAARQDRGVEVRRPAPRAVHLRTALDAVALMARRPVLILPLLVTVVIQRQVMDLVPYVPGQDPELVNPLEFARPVVLFWLASIGTFMLHIFAVAIVSHIAAQLELARPVSPGAALRRALIRLPASLGAYLVFFVRLFVGFLLLIIPGIVAFVRGALLAQAVVLGYAGPFRAFPVSAELLRGHWWRMAFLLAVEAGLVAILSLALGKVPPVGQYVAGALEATWVAVTLTLLYVRLGGATQPALASTLRVRALEMSGP
jgi:hypothetical protein